jgi:hypothetical protein
MIPSPRRRPPHLFAQRPFDGKEQDMVRIASLALAALAAAAVPAAAHHGWLWTEDGTFVLTGVIVEARLGNPHGLLTVDVEGERWTVEVGQPWRNARAGLEETELAPGTEIEASGHRSADPAQRLMKAERVTVGGAVHDLYPDRD